MSDTQEDENHRIRWHSERIARLGLLVGMGYNAQQIADDPMIHSTPNNIHRQMQRFGLHFRSVPKLLIQSLPSSVIAVLDAAAHKRGISTEKLAALLLMTAGSDASLVDNILDDGV